MILVVKKVMANGLLSDEDSGRFTESNARFALWFLREIFQGWK